MADASNTSGGRSAAATVGWGLFCAASWTWCIGMFFPLLLVRDFGWPGLVAFLVPNVLGCAGFGYVLDRASAARERGRHEGAMVAFSAVTVAYQVFFLSAVFGTIAQADGSGAIPPGWIAGGSAIVIGLFLSGLADRWWPWLATLAVGWSLSLWFRLDAGAIAELPASGERPVGDLVALAPMLAFGFLLCPYLDRTFHRALDRSPSRHAFAVFGVSFLAVILLGAAYFSDDRLLLPAVLGHLAIQACFTIAAHLREIRQAALPRGRRLRQAAIVGPTAVGIGLGSAAGTLLPFESIYLLFLGCYGVAFPGYVWMRMDLADGRGRRLDRAIARFRRLPAVLGGIPWTYLAALAIATPPAVAAVLGAPWWLLSVPVAVFLAAAMIGPSPDRNPRGDTVASPKG
jgi:hypothetical protein